MNLTTDKGPCNIDLQQSCKAIAIFLLFNITLAVLIFPGRLTESGALIGFIIILSGNLALLYGALKENKWLVLAWLLQETLVFIAWPIAILGVIFNFGSYRESNCDSVLGTLVISIVLLITHMYSARLVYSYFKQLRDRTSKPQHTVVV